MLHDGLDAAEQFRRSTAAARTRDRSVAAHVESSHALQIYVLDQDEALDFYVGKLGLEVSADVDLGFMRWLTGRVPGDAERQILLEKPGPARRWTTETAAQVRELVTKGGMGWRSSSRTDDCRATYEELWPRASSSPRSRPSAPTAIDCGLRDPFGNHIRVVQPAPAA